MHNELKKHWEDVYQNKKPNEVSWLQEIPKMSLEYIQQLNIPLSAKIIDINEIISKHSIKIKNNCVKILNRNVLIAQSPSPFRRIHKMYDRLKGEFLEFLQFHSS